MPLYGTRRIYFALLFSPVKPVKLVKPIKLVMPVTVDCHYTEPSLRRRYALATSHLSPSGRSTTAALEKKASRQYR